MAVYGSGKPVIAIHTEFDSTPGNSQTPEVTEHRPLVEGAPGHAEGHNVNAAVMIGAAFAVKKTMEEFNLGGTLKIIGAPLKNSFSADLIWFETATLTTSTLSFTLTSGVAFQPSMVFASTP